MHKEERKNVNGKIGNLPENVHPFTTLFLLCKHTFLAVLFLFFGSKKLLEIWDLECQLIKYKSTMIAKYDFYLSQYEWFVHTSCSTSVYIQYWSIDSQQLQMGIAVQIQNTGECGFSSPSNSMLVWFARLRTRQEQVNFDNGRQKALNTFNQSIDWFIHVLIGVRFKTFYISDPVC